MTERAIKVKEIIRATADKLPDPACFLAGVTFGVGLVEMSLGSDVTIEDLATILIELQQK